MVVSQVFDKRKDVSSLAPYKQQLEAIRWVVSNAAVGECVCVCVCEVPAPMYVEAYCQQH